MNNKDFKPSKAMGQNFLSDDNISRKIVKLSGVDKTCGVLEVGPGLGALTRHLAGAAGHVTAIELDRRLAEQLLLLQDELKNVTIIQGDILKQDLAQIAAETLPELKHHVCANLPYSITTLVITKLLESRRFQTVTVMVQKEVAQRMCASPGTSEYGAFTVFVGYYTKPDILFDIPPECFTPRPKVTSSVVKMTIRTDFPLKPDGDDERLLFRVVRAAFGQRRKTIVNALYAAFSETHSKEKITYAVKSLGLDEKIRGEVLGLEQFISLTDALKSNRIT